LNNCLSLINTIGLSWNILATRPGYARVQLINVSLPYYACYKYIHTYHSRFIPKGVAEASQIFLQDTHVLPKLVRNTADVTDGKPIAVLLESISGGSAINPIVAFYDIHGGKREVLFFYFVPDTTLSILKTV
jgi:hypothetical protein